MGFEVVGTTYGQAPSYSSDFILEKFEDDKLNRKKKLCLAKSLLGLFYTMFGCDETFIKDEIYSYHAINSVTISPYKEFESAFEMLSRLFREWFVNHKFIPFRIHSMYVPGLQVRYQDEKECTVYDALFNGLLNTYRYPHARGDIKYGYDEWINDGFNPIHEVSVTLTPPPQ